MITDSESLAALQRRLQDHIRRGDLDVGGIIARFDAADARERFGIYADAYRLRLQEALAHNYPMLQLHLGESALAEIALVYLEAHPSSDVSIREFGRELDRWLEANRPDEPWLGEFARFEWALGRAFDADDSTALSVEALTTVSPNDWARLAFKFSTATQRLTLRTNAAELYKAATTELPPAHGIVLGEPSEWLVWRYDLRAQYRSIAPIEALAIDVLLAGGTFGDACERLLEKNDDESIPMQAAALLKRWVTDEMIVDCKVLD